MAKLAVTPPLAMPELCCCCLNEPQTTYAVSGKTHKESGFVMLTRWQVPVCAACGQRLVQSRNRRLLASLVVVVAVLAGAWLTMYFGGWVNVPFIGAGLAGAVILWRGTMSAPAMVGWTVLDEARDCACVATRCGLVRACQIPRFQNREYEREFRELNEIEQGRRVRVQDRRRSAEAAREYSMR